jgi:23S rRNA pseudouridine2605 synthase
MRLAKYVAHCGIASRRAAEKLITAGRVTVGGELVTDPARDVDDASNVAIDGARIRPEAHEAWVVNKPEGVTSTAREPGKRTAVVELVDSPRRLYPVGRLDADSTGLILLTNDGELANLLTHPRYGIPKTYRAKLRRPPTPVQIRQLRAGLELEDGPTQPAQVKRAGESGIEITITEGRNRQVRRMLEKVGNEVLSLRRVWFASLRLAGLPEGEARQLSRSELRRLWKDAEPMSGPEKPERGRR